MILFFETLQRSKKSYGRLLEPVCQKWKLTRNELDVLLFLANNPEYDRAADIVERRGIAKSHVSLAVTRLLQRGLLSRSFAPADRRAAHLKLTEAAAQAVDEGRQAQRSFFEQIFAGLTPEELERWRQTVEKVSKNIEAMEIV